MLSNVSDAVALMRRDHVDTLGLKLQILPIAVVSAIANQSLGSGNDTAVLSGSFEKGDLMRRDMTLRGWLQEYQRPLSLP